MSEWNKTIEEGKSLLLQPRIELIEKTLIMHYNQIKELHVLFVEFIDNTEKSLEQLMDRIVELEKDA